LSTEARSGELAGDTSRTRSPGRSLGARRNPAVIAPSNHMVDPGCCASGTVRTGAVGRKTHEPAPRVGTVGAECVAGHLDTVGVAAAPSFVCSASGQRTAVVVLGSPWIAGYQRGTDVLG